MYPHYDLFEEWIRLANYRLPAAFFKMDDFSISEFAGALNAVGLQTPDDWIQTIDVSKRPNTSGEYALKKAYLDGNIRYIESTVPELWNMFRRKEHLLRPFLEQQGYKNLIWWS